MVVTKPRTPHRGFVRPEAAGKMQTRYLVKCLIQIWDVGLHIDCDNRMGGRLNLKASNKQRSSIIDCQARFFFFFFFFPLATNWLTGRSCDRILQRDTSLLHHCRLNC